MDLHVGIDIHTIPPDITKKLSNFSLGGEYYVTINNGGLSTADEISFFRMLKFIRFSRPRTDWGGKCNTQHHVI